MVLNYIWIGFVLLSVLIGLFQLIFNADGSILNNILQSTFDSAKTGFEISLGLTGVLSLWMGIMKIGEVSGVVENFSKWVSPFFRQLFPQLPNNHPAFGKMVMNLSATMLGIDNAATPLGLDAMRELQNANPDKQTATNPMIMFLVLVTSGLTLVPVSIMTYRAQLHAANPADVFIPILIATYCAVMGGVILTAGIQHINLLQRNLLLAFAILSTFVGIFVFLGIKMGEQRLSTLSTIMASLFLLGIICWFIIKGLIKKINVYDAFIDGAKGGFAVAIGIVPYLIAILVAIGMFRASGGMEWILSLITALFSSIGINTDFIPALPTALMRPLSGSGARGMMIDAMMTYGVDSFVGRLVSVVQGSTDTTLYIIAVYFGSVNIKKTRYALICGLFADLCGIIAAIAVSYLFFHL